MAEVKVTADIDKARKKVVLTPQGPISDPRDTFLVAGGDTLTWDLTAPVPQGFEAVVTFVAFPSGPAPSLLKEGNTLRTKGKAIRGTVNTQAAKGHYQYRVDLVSPSEKIELQCFWGTAGQPPERTAMGGGEKSAEPGG